MPTCHAHEPPFPRGLREPPRGAQKSRCPHGAVLPGNRHEQAGRRVPGLSSCPGRPPQPRHNWHKWHSTHWVTKAMDWTRFSDLPQGLTLSCIKQPSARCRCLSGCLAVFDSPPLPYRLFLVGPTFVLGLDWCASRSHHTLLGSNSLLLSSSPSPWSWVD